MAKEKRYDLVCSSYNVLTFSNDENIYSDIDIGIDIEREKITISIINITLSSFVHSLLST